MDRTRSKTTWTRTRSRDGAAPGTFAFACYPSGVMPNPSASSFVSILLGCALAACASGPQKAGSASTTAADVADAKAPSEAPAAKAARAATAPQSGAGDALTEGELVCKATDAFGVTSELRIAWKGREGEGVLRQVAPSGMGSDTRVRAEREGDVIFADDVRTEPDLLLHTASVTRKDGKAYLRVGDAKQAWTRCE